MAAVQPPLQGGESPVPSDRIGSLAVGVPGFRGRVVHLVASFLDLLCAQVSLLLHLEIRLWRRLCSCGLSERRVEGAAIQYRGGIANGSQGQTQTEFEARSGETPPTLPSG